MRFGTLEQVGTIPLDRAEAFPLPHWKTVARQPEEVIGTLDLAFMQFVALAGLPGSEDLNPWGCMRRLNAMADRVEARTNAAMHLFRHNPADHENSEAYFRALGLATVLQKDFGVGYDKAKAPREVPHKVEDKTVHGIIYGNGGTCASLPVLYAAVGRRLGYPIKLVHSFVDEETGHVFARWDGDGARFNIEATATGLATPPDDYYRAGKYKMTPQMEAWGRYMLSLSPKEEFAGFLTERARLWGRAGNRRLKAECAAWAFALDPPNVVHEDYLKISLNEWTRWTKEREPPGFPSIEIETPRGHRFFPDALPRHYEQQILGLTAVEHLLLDAEYGKVWERMRRGEWRRKGPNTAVIAYRHDGSSEAEVRFGGEV